MAGERIGKTYEALLKVALDRLHASGVLEGTVFWNETPIGISVEPDFSVGDDKDHPKIVIMVTHSGSSKNSDMKCWRNIGELCEIKSSISPAPLALSVFFESVMKEQLKKLQGTAFDAQLIVDARPYGAALKSWVHENEADLPTDQAEKAIEIERRCATDTVLLEVTAKLTEDLEEMLATATLHMNELWQYENVREIGAIPRARTTFIRRGLSKLLIFEDITLATRLFRGKTVRNEELPNYLFDIGLARKAIGKAAPSDMEVQGVFDILDDTTIQELYHSMDDNAVVQQMIAQLRREENLKVMAKYVSDEFASLSNKDILYARLMQLHADPKALVDVETVGEDWAPNIVWLFDTMMEIVKLSTGKANGYGYAQLAADIANPSGPARGRSEEARSFLLSPWGYMSDWTTRSNRTQVPDEVIQCVADVLSDKFSKLGREKVTHLSNSLVASYIHNLLEAKLCTYRLFEPLFQLLAKHIEHIEKKKIRTCFAEKAGISGAAGQTTVAIANHTAIKWQTATDAGKDHKRKELCGRAVGLRYTWDATENTFKPRPEVQKLVLLLDGTWTQKDLDALIKAGWDEIYYPDEIDKLKAAIV